MKLTSIVFGTVHSDRTVVVLLHKHFSSWISTFCNSTSITMNCMYANISESHIMASVNNSFNFFKSAYYVYFLSSTDCLLPNFHLDCTRWCRFMYLCFSFILVTKANAVEEGTTSTTWLYHQCNQSIHINDGVSNTRSVATDHLCQIVLNQQLLCKFKKWCKFSSHVKTKSCKNETT